MFSKVSVPIARGIPPQQWKALIAIRKKTEIKKTLVRAY